MDPEKVVRLLKMDHIWKLVNSFASPKEILIGTRVHRVFDVFPYIEGISDEDTKDIIETLMREEALEVVEHSNTPSCPYCTSVNLVEHFRCPYCRTTNIKKVYMIQHIECGKSFTADKFKLDSCPRCGSVIKNIDDVKIIGGLFHCNECGETFETPDIRYKCLNCGYEFGIREANVKKIYRYRIKGESLKTMEAIYGYKLIHDKLSELGFKVEIAGTLNGLSGIKHEFPLVLRYDEKIYTIDITGLMTSLTDEYLFKLYMIASDTPNVVHICIARENPVKKYNIPSKGNVTWVLAEDIEDALVKIMNLLGGETNV